MRIRKELFFFFLLFSLACRGGAQKEENGLAVLVGGDSLEGVFRYEEDRLFAGVEFLRKEEKAEAYFLSADTLRILKLNGKHYRSLSIPESDAGIKSRSLVFRKRNGRMKLYEGRYRKKSCSCQDYASIRKGAFIRKEGEERIYLVKKNRLLDRIKNPDELASAFLPHDDLMEAVRDREYRFSGIEKAVERYNERSKATSDP